LFLDVSVGKGFFCLLVGDSFAVDMMSHFVDQDIVEKEAAEPVEAVKIVELKGVGIEKNAGIPITSVTPELAPPGLLLLTGSGEQEHRAQAASRRFGHSFEARSYFRACASVDEVWRLRLKDNDVREFRKNRYASVKTFEHGTDFSEKRIVLCPIRKLGHAIGVASRA